MKIAIIGAMDVEIYSLCNLLKNKKIKNVSNLNIVEGELFDKEVVVLKCNVGKVNAAIATELLILLYNIDCVINIGIAGGYKNLQPNSIAIAKDVLQHDIDTTAFSDPKGLIDGISKVKLNCDKSIIEKLKTASSNFSCNPYLTSFATGDQFLLSDDIEKVFLEFKTEVFEMEFGAIAQTCFVNNIPFGALKVISDGGELDTYLDNKIKTANLSTEIISEFIKIY